MSIVTKTGDSGDTGLVGGKRLPKSDVRLHAYGTVDELNSLLGLTLAEETLGSILRGELSRIQHLLFRLGADLATPLPMEGKRIEAPHVRELEKMIARLEGTLAPLHAFILPGGSRAGALLHTARTVCRRSERWTVALSRQETIHPEALVFLNRLGDYLFLAAREANRQDGAAEVKAAY